LPRVQQGRAVIEPMTIEEKLREIMLSEELSDSEKLDRLHALIPADAFTRKTGIRFFSGVTNKGRI
jgi:hypothetical protein